MKTHSIIIAAFSVALGMHAGAQTPPAAGDSVEMQAAATYAALAPLVAPRTAELSAAGVQKVVARTGTTRREIQVLTKWGPGYLSWPKGVSPVAFEIYLESASAFNVMAAGYTEANKAQYAAAFAAVLPLAVRRASEMRTQAQRPTR